MLWFDVRINFKLIVVSNVYINFQKNLFFKFCSSNFETVQVLRKKLI